MRGRSRLPAAVALLALPAALCAASGAVSVAVVPTSAAVVIGGTWQFAATVRNASDASVIWQVNGTTGGDATVGTITTAGLYTAPSVVPSPATVTVKAVSQADSTKSASAVAAITPPQVEVRMSPASAAVQPGGSAQFTATVVNAANTAVTWEVNGVVGGSPAAGAITGSGLYTAPSAPPSPAIVVVTAISQQTPAAAANATITVGAGPAYYVATTGDDHNDGSFGAPWRTIQHAANAAIAGDTVYVMGGVYNEVVTFPNSGSAGAGYITFASYPGQTAVVDGTGLAIPGGQYGLFTVQDRSYLVISGFEIRNYSTDSAADVPIGIYITGADSYIRILGNRIHHIVTTARGCNANALGLAVYGSSAPASITHLTISGNEIYHLTTGCSESLSIDGNVEEWRVANNLIHDNNNIGIELASEHSGQFTSYVTARSNLVYASNSAGISIGGYDAKRGGTDHCDIVNNTLFMNDTQNTGSGEFQIQFYATNNLLENNILSATSQGLFVYSFTTSSPNPAGVDYNLYFGASAGIWEWNGTKHKGLAAFQSASGQDSHSAFANPLFLDTAMPDLHVQPSSPAVDAGINLGSTIAGALDFDGNPRVAGANIDIGACEQP